MNSNNYDIIPDPQGVGYLGHTLMKGSSIRGSYTVKEGTELIMGVAFRKRENLSAVILPESLRAIGDASFSFCKALNEVTIPASVEYIGVAAFSCSGLESVTFLGTPKKIEKNVFIRCNNLKQIIVPQGKKQYFIDCLGKECSSVITESVPVQEPATSQYQPHAGYVINEYDMFGGKSNVSVVQPNLFTPVQETPSRPVSVQSTNVKSETKQPEINLFGDVIVKRSRLYYNQREFNWAIDDEVKLSELFSGPNLLKGDPSYQFRKKALFIFIKSRTAQKTNLLRSTEYALAANTSYFKSKYEEKYSRLSTPVRIFIFVCDDNEHARFFDEVRFARIASNAIIVKSQIKF